MHARHSRIPVQNIINGLHDRDLIDDARSVAKAHHVKLDEMLGRSQMGQAVKARHALIKLWCVDRKMDNSFVGRLLCLDPTTVLQAKRKAVGQSIASS